MRVNDNLNSVVALALSDASDSESAREVRLRLLPDSESPRQSHLSESNDNELERRVPLALARRQCFKLHKAGTGMADSSLTINPSSST